MGAVWIVHVAYGFLCSDWWQFSLFSMVIYLVMSLSRRLPPEFQSHIDEFDSRLHTLSASRSCLKIRLKDQAQSCSVLV